MRRGSKTSTIEWTPQTIVVHIGDKLNGDRRIGSETVQALVWQDLAVHPAIEIHRLGWTVTHVPTGRAITDAASERRAKRFVERVAPLTDWTTVQPGVCPPEIRDEVVAAARAARRYDTAPRGDESSVP